MNEQQPIRIVVEVVSSADVKRLEERDEQIREEIAQVARRMDGINRTLYEALEAIGRLRQK